MLDENFITKENLTNRTLKMDPKNDMFPMMLSINCFYISNNEEVWFKYV